MQYKRQNYNEVKERFLEKSPALVCRAFFCFGIIEIVVIFAEES